MHLISMIYQGRTLKWECESKYDAEFLRSSLRLLYPDATIFLVTVNEDGINITKE